VWTLATNAEHSLAQTPPVVVVVRTSIDERLLGESFARAAHDRLRYHDRSAYALPPVSVPESLEARLTEAIGDYHALEPERASRSLESIVESFDRTGAGLSRTSLLDLFAYLALVEFALGDSAGANEAMDRALAVDPAFVPTPTRFPPAFRAKVEARRATTRLAGLRFVVAPAGARIALDGIEFASGDAARSVASGVHVVRVEAPHHRAFVERLVVPGEGLERIVALESDPVELLRNGGRAGDEIASLRAAATSIGAALLVVDVVADGSSIRATLVDDAEAIERAATFDATTAPSEILDRLYEPPVSVSESDDAVERAVPSTSDGSHSGRRRRRILAVASGAAAAIALAFGLGFGLAGRDRFVGSFQRDAR